MYAQPALREWRVGERAALRIKMGVKHWERVLWFHLGYPTLPPFIYSAAVGVHTGRRGEGKGKVARKCCNIWC